MCHTLVAPTFGRAIVVSDSSAHPLDVVGQRVMHARVSWTDDGAVRPSQSMPCYSPAAFVAVGRML